MPDEIRGFPGYCTLIPENEDVIQMRRSWVRFWAASITIGVVAAACTRCKRETRSTSAPEPSKSKMSQEVSKAIDDLTQAWIKMHSMSAKVHVKINNAAGKPGETVGGGTYAYAMIDGQPHIRFWMANSYTFQLTETESRITAEAVRHWTDGKFHYKYLHQPELRRVTKMRYDPANVLQIGGPEAFRDVLNGKEVNLIYGEHINGVPMTVFETIPEEGNTKTRNFFDPNTGIRMQIEQLDAAGQATVTITLSEIKVNPELDTDVFQYEVPEGFEFVDETK
ncbi:MAG: outer membrane lipoprotein carrier protein LolA [Planctomycetes bacterium]|nr:outer membrane lipoprotein carrier protein LolA [Planctomycetota bacterium]